MPPTDRTDTHSERSTLPTLTIAPGELRFDSQGQPTLDTSDDPTGAVILWGLAFLLIYVVLGLGFVLAR